MNNKILVKRLTDTATIPEYQTDGAAAADLCADCPGGVVLQPDERVKVGTGVAIALPSSDYVGLVFARSGLASKQGIALSNGVGVIDSDYRGELKIALVNNSEHTVIIEHGQRVAQLAIMPVVKCDFCETDILPKTDRDEGGFGSTGMASPTKG